MYWNDGVANLISLFFIFDECGSLHSAWHSFMVFFLCIGNPHELVICGRQRAAGGPRGRPEVSKRPGAPRERPSRGVGAPDANAELAISLHVWILVILIYLAYPVGERLKFVM